MLYHNKDNNQHIYIIKEHDSIYINKSNIYNISHAYEKIIDSPDSKANSTQK